MIRPAALALLLAFPALAPLALATEAKTDAEPVLLTTKSDRGPTREMQAEPPVMRPL